MKIYFVRHGESEANVLHEISNRPGRHPLTEAGRQQSAALGVRLKARLHPAFTARIFSSPLLRAIETSAIVAQELAAPVENTDALREFDLGVLEGRADEAAWQGYMDLWRRWEKGFYDECMPGGESFKDMQARFIPFVQSLVERYQNRAVNVICVSHGGLYACMLPEILTNLNDSCRQRPIGHTDMIIAEDRPAGLVCLEWCGLPLEYP